MEIEYSADADAAYIRFNHRKIHTSKPVCDRKLVIDIAEDGTPVGIELISPSLFVEDLERLVALIKEQQQLAKTE